jgi:hypothetical protein
MNIKAGDWVIWVDEINQSPWIGRHLQVAKIELDSTGLMLFFHKPAWYGGNNWHDNNGWYSHRVRKDEAYEVELLLNEYEETPNISNQHEQGADPHGSS